MRYTRDVPPGADPDLIPQLIHHVRAHLSSVAHPFDDPRAHADAVAVHVVTDEGGRPVRIVGDLDRQPDAPYLRPGFDPEDDVVANPLTVPSILDQGVDR